MKKIYIKINHTILQSDNAYELAFRIKITKKEIVTFYETLQDQFSKAKK